MVLMPPPLLLPLRGGLPLLHTALLLFALFTVGVKGVPGVLGALVLFPVVPVVPIVVGR